MNIYVVLGDKACDATYMCPCLRGSHPSFCLCEVKAAPGSSESGLASLVSAWPAALQANALPRQHPTTRKKAARHATAHCAPLLPIPPLFSLYITTAIATCASDCTRDTRRISQLAPSSRFFTTVRVSCDFTTSTILLRASGSRIDCPAHQRSLKTRSCLSGLAVATQAQPLADSAAPITTTTPRTPRAALCSAAILLQQAASAVELQLVASAAATRATHLDSPKTKPASVHQPPRQAAACSAAREERAQLVASVVEEDSVPPTMPRALDSARQTQQVRKEQALSWCL